MGRVGWAKAIGCGIRLGALAFALSACERGCLAKRFLGDGAGGVAPGSAGNARAAADPASARNPSAGLLGTDCSDGLLRCQDGLVEASRWAVLPQTCSAARGEGNRACTCPWDPVAHCPSGCAVDGLEVVGGGDAAKSAAGPDLGVQLCRPELPVARPILPGDPAGIEICAEAGVRCASSVVRLCDGAGRPSRPYAYCLGGCETGVAVEDEPSTWANRTVDGVVAILCRRDHAERR